MAKRKTKTSSRKRAGRGIVSSVIGKAKNLIPTAINKAIDLLPFEAHAPSYNFCGPGTKLEKRLARGDKGINPLDKACKTHDIAYSKYKDTVRRAQADRELADRAWQRVKASDSSLAQKAVAYAVTNIMKAKSGSGRRRRKQRGGKGLYLRPYPKRGRGQTCKQGNGKKKTPKKNVDPD